MFLFCQQKCITQNIGSICQKVIFWENHHITTSWWCDVFESSSKNIGVDFMLFHHRARWLECISSIIQLEMCYSISVVTSFWNIVNGVTWLHVKHFLRSLPHHTCLYEILFTKRKCNTPQHHKHITECWTPSHRRFYKYRSRK